MALSLQDQYKHMASPPSLAHPWEHGWLLPFSYSFDLNDALTLILKHPEGQLLCYWHLPAVYEFDKPSSVLPGSMLWPLSSRPSWLASYGPSTGSVHRLEGSGGLEELPCPLTDEVSLEKLLWGLRTIFFITNPISQKRKERQWAKWEIQWDCRFRERAFLPQSLLSSVLPSPTGCQPQPLSHPLPLPQSLLLSLCSSSIISKVHCVLLWFGLPAVTSRMNLNRSINTIWKSFCRASLFIFYCVLVSPWINKSCTNK